MVIVRGFERTFLRRNSFHQHDQGVPFVISTGACVPHWVSDARCPDRFLRLCLFIIISIIEQKHLFRHKIVPSRTALANCPQTGVCLFAGAICAVPPTQAETSRTHSQIYHHPLIAR